MKRIWITGDMHGDIDISKVKTFKKNMKISGDTLDREDIIIVCGDMGICWDGGAYDRYIKKYWEQQPFTVLFVDGNHENFSVLATHPWQDSAWGAPVRQIAENVSQLKRGSVYTIYNRTFFAFGGASSHDKWCRKEGRDWWPEEMPTPQEYEDGIKALAAHDWRVDCIISHCTDDKTQSELNPNYEHDALTNYFRVIKMDLDYDYHFFGHYHTDRDVTPKDIALYYRFIQLV